MALYQCPYAGCTFSSHCQIKDGYVIRPDRTCDLLEHWYITHMATTLKYRCLIAGCERVHQLYKTVKQFREHLVKHYSSAKKSDPVITDHVNTALAAFTENSGDEPAIKDITASLKYPDNHVTATQFKKIEAELKAAKEVEEEVKQKAQRKLKDDEAAEKADAKLKERAKKDAERDVKAAAKKTKDDTTRVEKRQARHHEAAGSSSGGDRKRATYTATTAHPMKRARGELVPSQLTIKPSDDRCPMADVTAIGGAFTALQLAHKTRVANVMTEALSKMEDASYGKKAVCAQINVVRTAMNFHRDDLDTSTRTFSDWQMSLGNDPPVTAPSRQLVHPAILHDASRVPELEETVRRLTLELRASQDENATLRGATGPAPSGAASLQRGPPPVALSGTRERVGFEMWADDADILQAALARCHSVVAGRYRLP